MTEKEPGGGSKKVSPPESKDIVEEIQPEVDEVKSAIQKLSRQKPGTVTEIMAMMGVGPVVNPIHHKMNEAHISQVLDLACQHDEREYNLHKTSQENRASQQTSNRRYMFAGFAAVLVLVVIVLILFRDNPDVLIPVLSGIGGLAGGLLGGWGIGRSSDS